MGRAPLTQGKGDKLRPRAISEEEYVENWNHIFRKPRPAPTDEPSLEDSSPDSDSDDRLPDA